MSLFLLRHYITEAVHGASKAYMRKEVIKDIIQNALFERVASGEIANQADVDSFFATIDMAVRALKMVPYDVLSSVAKPDVASKTKKRRA